MSAKKLVGVFGGTFDPIHHGHLRLAVELQNRLELDQIRLLPLKQPAHRTAPIATEQQRLRMLQLAIAGTNKLIIDERELQRESISYSIDTLRSLDDEFNDETFCLLLGRDAFANFDSWKEWQSILNLCHVIVASRPGNEARTFNSSIMELLAKHETKGSDRLKSQKNGLILQCEIPMLDISSSDIRSKTKSNMNCRYLLPNRVIEYIKQENLYA